MSSDSGIYLDHNATSPMKPAVREAMVAALDCVGNPSSVHRFGRAARRLVEDARERVAALAGAAPADLVFTGSGTEANNLALRGSGRPRCLASAIEHDSVLAAWPDAELIPVHPDGTADLDVLTAMLAADPRPAIVSVMLANNETGVIQPVAAVAEIARRSGALVHCDAVQAAGRLPLDRAALAVDYLSLSAHKIGGPTGVGVLACAPDAPLAPLVVGGGQERRRRAGTENLPGIVGFGAAAELAVATMGDQDRVAALRNRLEDRLESILPGVTIHGRTAPRLSNTSCIGSDGLRGELQVMALDLDGIAVSAGAACSSGKVGPSRVLLAMGVPADEAACAIRVSLGAETIEADIAAFIEAWARLHRRSAARAA